MSVGMEMEPKQLSFLLFLIVFGGTEVPIVYILLCQTLSRQPTTKCHPRWQPI
jgi:hypothetical protein